MLARSKLGDHAAVFRMRDLRRHNGRQDADAILDYSRGGFIA
jgi:hypothetical protein